MQIALVVTVGMRVVLGKSGRKDYALLNAERMVHIFFVINAFKNFFVLLMLIKCFCVYFFIYYYQFFFWFSRLALVLRMWSVLVFRSVK